MFHVKHLCENLIDKIVSRETFGYNIKQSNFINRVI